LIPKLIAELICLQRDKLCIAEITLREENFKLLRISIV